MALSGGLPLTSESPPEADGRVAVPPAPRLRTRTFFGSPGRRLGAAVVILGAIGFLVYQGLGNATVYFKTADQAVADRASLGTKQFRIEGTVQNDVRQAGGQTDFSIYANRVTVRVVDSKEPPQLFKPGIPVVLEGHWSGSYFASDLVMVKHSASYSAAHPDRLEPQAPSSSSVPAGGSGP
ncbi:MAG: cytochrome c maturation protein CcmE [Acidimicrobiales bacterium]|nr:cytochrome c maturation protein CcmE [Acidimicrobiales bacterium]